jgi:subtilisin family serine protease
MKKLFTIILFWYSVSLFSQEEAWVYFADKPNASYFFSNPTEMLTQRSLDRRTNQNIALNMQDVPVHQPYVDLISMQTGIQVKAQSKWLNCVHVRGSVTNIQALSSLTFVNQIRFANATLNAKFPSAKKEIQFQKNLETQTTFAYGTSANQIQMLNGHILYQQNYTGTGKIIAVLDSGFINVNTAQPFERLFTNNLILGGYNFVSANTNVYSLHNHGTLVLSSIGGFKPNQLVGTAPDAQYYLYITEDVTQENPVEESYWVQAAEEADRVGADIITSSLGYSDFDNSNYNHTYSDLTGNAAFASQGANVAFSKGIVVVASAGNSGASSNPYIGVPAEATNVLAIGAVQSNENYASFSSIGPTFDNRIKPDLMAQGQSTYLSNTNGDIITASGTSFSCPIMAGVIACLWQAAPNLTNQQLVDLIKQSADRFMNPTAQFGYGIPDFQDALNQYLLGVQSVSKNSLAVYPNPTNSIINFPIAFADSQAEVTLYNSLGKQIISKNINSSDFAIDVSDYSNGIYLYAVKSGVSFYSGKFLKN